MKYRDPSKCELRRERARDGTPCHGSVKKIGVVSLCLKHRKLVAGILHDSEGADIRHPDSKPVFLVRAMA